MIIIDPSYSIQERDDIKGNMSMIERAGRICYKSEASKNGPEKFVSRLIEHHHEAMLEHGDYIFMLDEMAYFLAASAITDLERTKSDDTPILLNLTKTVEENNGSSDIRYIISGNIRAWRNALKQSYELNELFYPYINSVYTKDIEQANKKKIIGTVTRTFPSNLINKKELENHCRSTVIFTVDRGITHELVRHRLFSFAMESTRYCRYSQDKFGNQITVINPLFFDEKDTESSKYDLWKKSCEQAEKSYMDLLEAGATPEEARTVLPNSVKADIVVTGTLGEWNRFFDLRARQVTGPAHPQMVQISVPLFEDFKKMYPFVFEGE